MAPIPNSLLFPREDFALEDEDLDPDDAVGGLRLGETVVDVGPQGVQRHTALTVPLGTAHLRSAKTTATVDFDPLSAELEGLADALLHCPAKGNPALKLKGDTFRHQ